MLIGYELSGSRSVSDCCCFKSVIKVLFLLKLFPPPPGLFLLSFPKVTRTRSSFISCLCYHDENRFLQLSTWARQRPLHAGKEQKSTNRALFPPSVFSWLSVLSPWSRSFRSKKRRGGPWEQPVLSKPTCWRDRGPLQCCRCCCGCCGGLQSRDCPAHRSHHCWVPAAVLVRVTSVSGQFCQRLVRERPCS